MVWLLKQREKSLPNLIILLDLVSNLVCRNRNIKFYCIENQSAIVSTVWTRITVI